MIRRVTFPATRIAIAGDHVREKGPSAKGPSVPASGTNPVIPLQYLGRA